jgi:hypothetical protein
MTGWLLLIFLLLTGCGASVLDVTFAGQPDDRPGSAVLPDGLEAVNASAVIGNDEVLRLTLTESTPGESGYLLLAPQTPLDDYTVEARVRLLSGQVRLWARTDSDLCSGYALGINPTTDVYRLDVSSDGCSLNTLDRQTRRRVDLQTWHTLRLEVRGDTVRGLVDGVAFFEATDVTFKTGIAALEVVADISGAHLEVDRVSVSR